MSSTKHNLLDSSIKECGLNTTISWLYRRIDSTGDYFTTAALDEVVLPGLYSPELGTIPLPLQESIITDLLERSSPTELRTTGGNTPVYKTLASSEVEFRNPAWFKYVDQVSARAADELGIKADVKAIFHNLSICAKGAAFEMPEMMPGAFATLLICLPTKHCGGDIKLQHDGKTRDFSTDKNSEFGLSYLAWYKDVAYEISPISSGVRVILTYKLVNAHQGNDGEFASTRLTQMRSKYHQLLAIWQDMSTDWLVLPLRSCDTRGAWSVKSFNEHDVPKAKFFSHFHPTEGPQDSPERIVTLLANLLPPFHHLDEDWEYRYGRRQDCDKYVLSDVREFDGEMLHADRYDSWTVPYENRLQDWDPDDDEDAEVHKVDCNTCIRYRDALEQHRTVIVLVKESHLLEFLLGKDLSQQDWDYAFSSRVERFIKSLEIRLETASKSASASRWLLQLYDLCMQGGDAALGAAAICSVILKDADKFQAAVDRLRTHFRNHTYAYLGQLIDIDNPSVYLDDLQNSFTKSGSLYLVTQNISAFSNASDSQRHSALLKCFEHSVVHEVLKTSVSSDENDARAIDYLLCFEVKGERTLWKSVLLEAIRDFVYRHKEGKEWLNFFIWMQRNGLENVNRYLGPVMLSSMVNVFDLEFWTTGERLSGPFNLAKVFDFIHLDSPAVLPALWKRILSEAKTLSRYSLLDVLVTCIIHDVCPPEFCQDLAEVYLLHALGPQPKLPESWTLSLRADGYHHYRAYNEDGAREDIEEVERFLLHPGMDRHYFGPDRNISFSYDFAKVPDFTTGGVTIIKNPQNVSTDEAEWYREFTDFTITMNTLSAETLLKKFGSRCAEITSGRIVRPPVEEMQSGSGDHQYSAGLALRGRQG